jgi:hypothetical protein
MKKNAAKGYEKTNPKTNPILSAVGGLKMNANAFSQKDYENETTFRPKKTNPNKANFKGKKMLLGLERFFCFRRDCEVSYLLIVRTGFSGNRAQFMAGAGGI